MITSPGFVLAAIVLAAGVTGCDPDAQHEEEPLGEAREEQCGGYVVTNVVPQPGTVHVVSPQYLIDSVEAWGPQTLLLAVDRSVSIQMTVHSAPGVQIQKDKLTKSLQHVLGFDVSHQIEVTASSSTVVDEGSYKRLEAYPTFQVLNWDLWMEGYGGFGATRIGSGTVYRPMGVYFQLAVLVQGPKKDNNTERRQPQPGSITAIGSPVLGSEAVFGGHHEH